MIIFDHKFVTLLLLSTYGLLVWEGQFLLLFFVTALVLVMYFATLFVQHKSERDFQTAIKEKLDQIQAVAKKASDEAELARQETKDLGAKYGFKSISK